MKVKVSVSCKYWVTTKIDLPEEIYNEIMNTEETFNSDSIVSEYLSDRIREDDASDWEYEVFDIEKV
jgi:hypothetical protein